MGMRDVGDSPGSALQIRRLLSSGRMHQLVNLESSGEFDLILFDTPPVVGLADASLVAEHCDGLMLS